MTNIKYNTGSVENQILLLTKNINKLQKHFTKHKKDVHSKYGLLKQVTHRRKLLNYIYKKNHINYKKIVELLRIRK